VVIGGAPFRVLEAVGQEQKTTLEIDGLHLLAPELIGKGNHREAEVLLAQAEVPEEFFGHLLEALAREGLGAVHGLADISRGRTDAIAQFSRLRNDLEMGSTWSLIFLLNFRLSDGGSHGLRPQGAAWGWAGSWRVESIRQARPRAATVKI